MWSNEDPEDQDTRYNMDRKIIITKDGSKTIQITDWNEQYHSTHGAIQEAYHVFIRMGLDEVDQPHVDLLEIGFGTGLNALITYHETKETGKTVHYTGIEAFPVKEEEWQQLDYPGALENPELNAPFELMHRSSWEQGSQLAEHFSLLKLQRDFRELDFTTDFDLVYFDAFGARVQPELWTEQVFEIMYKALRPGGILVTYAAKGSVRRAMQAVGFTVERLPGPPGKREMLRARK